MEAIRVGLVQVGWAGTREAMIETYRTLVAQAAAAGARLICLPELTLSPYFPGTVNPSGFTWAEPFPGGITETVFNELARTHNVTIISSIFEQTPDGHYFDTALIHAPSGQVSGSTRKVHIPSGAGYNETHFFEAAGDYPVHPIMGVNVAAPTCYDQWFPELARIYALNGAQYIFYPTAIGSEPSDPAIDSQPMWQTVMRAHAITNGVFIGAANRIGVENDVTFYGSSFICDPTGRILAQAGRASVEVITADLDPHTLTHWRTLFPLLRQRMPHTYARLLDTPAEN